MSEEEEEERERRRAKASVNNGQYKCLDQFTLLDFDTPFQNELYEQVVLAFFPLHIL